LIYSKNLRDSEAHAMCIAKPKFRLIKLKMTSPTVTGGLLLDSAKKIVKLTQFERAIMPEKETIERAREDAREGKSPSTQAGEFVREEIDHVREGKHGARSPEQAIAIGLSKARRAGIKLPPPKGPASIRQKAAQDTKAGEHPHKTSAKRSRATENALKRESKSSTSRQAMSRQAKKASAKRGSRARSAAATKAARTRKAA
jgi:hypothetical protein